MKISFLRDLVYSYKDKKKPQEPLLDSNLQILFNFWCPGEAPDRDFLTSIESSRPRSFLESDTQILLDFYNALPNKEPDRDLTETEKSQLTNILNQTLHRKKSSRGVLSAIMQDLYIAMFRFSKLPFDLQVYTVFDFVDLTTQINMGQLNWDFHLALAKRIKRNINTFLVQLFVHSSIGMNNRLTSIVKAKPEVVVTPLTIEKNNPCTRSGLQLSSEANHFRFRDSLYQIISGMPQLKAQADQQLADLRKLTPLRAQELLNNYSVDLGAIQGPDVINLMVKNIIDALNALAANIAKMRATENKRDRSQHIGFEMYNPGPPVEQSGMAYHCFFHAYEIHPLEVIQVVLSDLRLDYYVKILAIKDQDFAYGHLQNLERLLSILRGYLPKKINAFSESIMSIKLSSENAILEPATSKEKEKIKKMFDIIPLKSEQSVNFAFDDYRVQRPDENTLLFLYFKPGSYRDTIGLKIQKKGEDAFIIQYKKEENEAELSYKEIDILMKYYPLFINGELRFPLDPAPIAGAYEIYIPSSPIPTKQSSTQSIQVTPVSSRHQRFFTHTTHVSKQTSSTSNPAGISDERMEIKEVEDVYIPPIPNFYGLYQFIELPTNQPSTQSNQATPVTVQHQGFFATDTPDVSMQTSSSANPRTPSNQFVEVKEEDDVHMENESTFF